jgi:hypothetical protein
MTKYYFIICLCLFTLSTNAQQNTIIEGNIKSPYNEPVSLTLYKYSTIIENAFTQHLVDSNFKFKFVLTEPAYFTLITNRNKFTLFLIEPGDSIHFDMNILKVEDVKFSGAGSYKSNYQYWAHIQYQDWYHPPADTTGLHYFKYLDSCRTEQLYSLYNFRGLLPSITYEILRADVFYGFENLKSKYVADLFNDSTSIDKANSLYHLYLPVRKEFVYNDTLAYSRNTLAFLEQQNEVDNKYLQLQNNWTEKYTSAKKHTKGKIQERLLAMLLLLTENTPATDKGALQCAKDYLNGPYDPLYKGLVREKYELHK